jgi:hypothetical protein
MATPPMVPAGWYADPAGRHEYRYWDGTAWTAGVADRGVTAADPLEAPPQPVQQIVAEPSPVPQPAAEPSPVQAAVEPSPVIAAVEPPPVQAAVEPSLVPLAQPAQQATAEPQAPPLPAETSPFAAVAAPAAAPRERRGWGVPVGIAVVVVLALAAGLAIWAPWKSPPLLKPTGLAADRSTVSSVAFHWADPATGPLPDKYLILHDGKLIGSVPGTVTSYHTGGLAPDTAYQYRIAAERGGKRSVLSAVLVVHTAVPPLSAARWQGTWTVAIKINKGRASIQGARKWTETWVAGPKCASGPCTVRLAAALNGHNFKVTLARSGARYEGTTHSTVFPCGKGSTAFPIRSRLTVRITLKTAHVDNGAWTASAWSGGMVVASPYTSSGNYYCPASTQTASLSGVP